MDIIKIALIVICIILLLYVLQCISVMLFDNNTLFSNMLACMMFIIVYIAILFAILAMPNIFLALFLIMLVILLNYRYLLAAYAIF